VNGEKYLVCRFRRLWHILLNRRIGHNRGHRVALSQAKTGKN
jgi:hypothetical protein